MQDPDDPEALVASDDALFRWDGTFVDSPSLRGDWRVVGWVGGIEGFDPANPGDTRHAWLKSVSLGADGKTDSGRLFWIDDTLMDLDRGHALTMTLKTIEGTEYLFVEAGGFPGPDPRYGAAAWKTPLMVMKRR
jgi:hypothetical protein